jgi:hypothetical protein
MSVPTLTSPPAAATLDTRRGTARLAGVLYLVTFLASIPAVVLLAPVLDDPAYVLGDGADTRVRVGAALDIVNALACIGTAVVLLPVVRRQHEALAHGFLASRVLEAAIILTGVVSLLAVVTLRQDPGAAGTDPDALVAVAAGLVAVRDWTFLLGPGLAVANALLLGTLMYRSRLVPRVIPVLGLVGAPLLLAANTATLFGLTEQVSVVSALALPGIFFWELSLGVWLVVKGFRPGPLAALLREPSADGTSPSPVERDDVRTS